MKRKPIIAGNWKMFKTTGEALQMVKLLRVRTADVTDREIVVCPPFTALKPVYDVLKETNIRVGAQNLFFEEQGAFTGEISPLMLVDAGCKYVIIGHSERRQFFYETDSGVNRKIVAAQKAGLVPIVCIGERLDERENEKTKEVVKRQLTGALQNLSETQVRGIVIAYEPVWAIGTGKTATPAQAQEVHEYIRELITDLYSSDTASMVRIQYGGSVKPDNIASLMSMKDIDGALVGGASLEADTFARIVKY